MGKDFFVTFKQKHFGIPKRKSGGYKKSVIFLSIKPTWSSINKCDTQILRGEGVWGGWKTLSVVFCKFLLFFRSIQEVRNGEIDARVCVCWWITGKNSCVSRVSFFGGKRGTIGGEKILIIAMLISLIEQHVGGRTLLKKSYRPHVSTTFRSITSHTVRPRPSVRQHGCWHTHSRHTGTHRGQTNVNESTHFGKWNHNKIEKVGNKKKEKKYPNTNREGGVGGMWFRYVIIHLSIWLAKSKNKTFSFWLVAGRTTTQRGGGVT